MTLLTLVISIQSFFSQEVFTKMTFELLVQLPDRFFFPPEAQSMRVFFMIIHGSETRHTSTHTFIQFPPPQVECH